MGGDQAGEGLFSPRLGGGGIRRGRRTPAARVSGLALGRNTARGGASPFSPRTPKPRSAWGWERALLELLGRRVRRFAVPAVEYVSPGGRLQVRRMVEGTEVPGGYGRDRALGASEVGPRFAGELGRALAELHGSVTPAEAEALGLPTRGPFRPGRRRAASASPGPPAGPGTRARPRCRHERLRGADEEDVGHVLTHGDVGLDNLAVDPGAGRLVGIFDFEDAALGDRHVDLYSLHSYDDAFVEQTLDAYAAAAGARLSEQRAALHHLYGAFEALATAAAKATTPEAQVTFAGSAHEAIVVERALHEGFFREFAVSAERFAATRPSPTCAGYSDFLLATAYQHPFQVAAAALLPCFQIYYEVGKHLYGIAAAPTPINAGSTPTGTRPSVRPCDGCWPTPTRRSAAAAPRAIGH